MVLQALGQNGQAIGDEVDPWRSQIRQIPSLKLTRFFFIKLPHFLGESTIKSPIFWGNQPLNYQFFWGINPLFRHHVKCD